MQRWIKWTGAAIVSLTVCAVLCVVALHLLAVLLPLPDERSNGGYSKVFLSSDQTLLRFTLAPDERYRVHTPYQALPQSIIDATLLYEDENFYQHSGVNYLSIFRAAWFSYIVRSRRIGGSTITMQLARKLWNIPSHTIAGKVEQIFRAKQLENRLSKQDILERYFNIVSYGGNVEGVGAASLIYFNKPAKDLSALEAITLAVVPQNPNKRNPALVKGIENIYPARAILIEKFSDAFAGNEGLKIFSDLPVNVTTREQIPFKTPHFIDHVQQVINDFEPRYQGANTDQEIKLAIAGTTLSHIQTTLNYKLQSVVQEGVNNFIAEKKGTDIKNTAVLVLNYQTMQVESMIGSANFFDEKIDGQVNGATAQRSPGSTLKPFVYGLAIDKGLIHPQSLMKDTAQRYAGFSPENYDSRFLGPVSATDALIKSRNLPAVYLQSELIKQTRKPMFYNFLKQAGVKNLRSSDFYGLALSLGGIETSMLEIAQLYAMLANSGVFQTAKVINKPNSYMRKTLRLLSPEASFMTLDMLRKNKPIRLSRYDKKHATYDVLWKTGTSWAFRDAWSVAVVDKYIVAVWVGNFSGEGSAGFVGRKAAGPLLFSLIDRMVHSGYINSTWRFLNTIDSQKLNVKKINVCRKTGDIDTQHCPSTISTWFIPGVSPIQSTHVFRPIIVNRKTGLRACHFIDGETEIRVFQFWPSDFHSLFLQAGVRIPNIPEYETQCELSEKNTLGVSPAIISPQSTIEYILAQSNMEQTVPFAAIVDSDAKSISWFVNDTFFAQARPSEVLNWPLELGEHQIKVIDDSGRVGSVMIKVERY